MLTCGVSLTYTSSVVIRATTQRVDFIRECGTDDVCGLGDMQWASGVRGIPCTRTFLSTYSVRLGPVGFGGGVCLHCDDDDDESGDNDDDNTAQLPATWRYRWPDLTDQD